MAGDSSLDRGASDGLGAGRGAWLESNCGVGCGRFGSSLGTSDGLGAGRGAWLESSGGGCGSSLGTSDRGAWLDGHGRGDGARAGGFGSSLGSDAALGSTLFDTFGRSSAGGSGTAARARAHGGSPGDRSASPLGDRQARSGSPGGIVTQPVRLVGFPVAAPPPTEPIAAFEAADVGHGRPALAQHLRATSTIDNALTTLRESPLLSLSREPRRRDWA